MITLEECVEMCGLTQKELDAIVEHEHIPDIAAAALADYLLHLPKGPAILTGMIRDDLRAAIQRGDKAHAKTLLHALRHFMHEHPAARIPR